MEKYFADRQIRMIPHDKMAEYYSKIDLYICTSKIEGTPNPVLESMACGVPIISTDVSDIKNFADENVCLLTGVCEQTIAEAMKKASICFEKNGCLRDSFDYRQYLLATKNWLNEVFE